MVIPKALRGYIGRREVWRSLGTRDKQEALCRSSQFIALGQRLFFTLRRHGRHMTKHHIEAIVTGWLSAALDEAEDDRASRGYLSEAATEDAQDGLSAMLDGALEALQAGDYKRISREADELLQSAGLPALEHSSTAFRGLCRRLLRAKIEFARVEADRWNGEYQEHRQQAPLAVQTTRVPASKEVPSSHPFSAVLKKYLAANPRPRKTEDQAKAEFKRFVVILGGDKPIGEVTKADCVAYKEVLQVTRRLQPATCMRHLLAVAALFRWAEVHGFVVGNPALGLAPRKREVRKQAMKRRPFTDEELLTVFGSSEFIRQRLERPERYWVVLLLVFQVCRREEAGQLYLKDLVTVGGIPCIRIVDEEPDQTVKNEGSRRTIPLHSALVRLGFLDYTEGIKAQAPTGQQGHKRVFPQLTRKGNNGYSDPVGKWFGRLVTSLGITDPRVVIHSLRHGGITKLHSAGVPVNLVETLVGHSAGNVHQQYVHKELLDMKTLMNALEKLQYPFIADRS